jgi:hypothetical protein
MRRRRFSAPGTQLARAGERTKLLIGDTLVPQVRFKATTLQGAPQGSVSIETVHGTRTEDLHAENLLETDGLISLSVVPKTDTAITFVPVQRPSNPLFFILGTLVVGIGLFWTTRDFLGI